jgi:hypothetical protein
LEVCEERQEVLHVAAVFVRLPRTVHGVEHDEDGRRLRRKRAEVPNDVFLAGALDPEVGRQRSDELLRVLRTFALDEVAVDAKHLRDIGAVARGERQGRFAKTIGSADSNARGFGLSDRIDDVR